MLIILCSITLNNLAQTDTLQLYLVKPYVAPVLSEQDSLFITPSYVLDIPPFIVDILPWVIPYPYEPFAIMEWGTVTTYCVFVPTCGDSYHDNGELSSSIACKDSVLHGVAK